MLVKLTNLQSYKVDKQGAPLLDKKQQPYARIVIHTEQHGKTPLSGFAYQNSPIWKWKAGDEVEVLVTQNGQWTNFSLPKVAPQGAVSPMYLERIEKKVDEILRILKEDVDFVEPEPTLADGPQGDDIQPEDLPF